MKQYQRHPNLFVEEDVDSQERSQQREWICAENIRICMTHGMRNEVVEEVIVSLVSESRAG